MDEAKTRTTMALRPLPLGTLRPEAWLKDQLRIQANGLGGHLDTFWPDIARSKWIGGDAEGWERGPYWLDGFLPLAVLLQDAALLARARHWVDTILADQHDDGWMGTKDEPGTQPGTDFARTLDPWPLFLVGKALLQWEEATGDARVLPALSRCLARIDTLLDTEPLHSWAAMRWMDLAWICVRVAERSGDPAPLALAHKARAQGYDWHAHFADFRFPDRQTIWQLENHVVNHAMALKTPAVAALLGSDRELEAAALGRMLATLDRFHGQANGMFSGDESLAGLSPSQGTELCAVVEALFSLEVALSVFPDPALADRWEKIAFNALPATFTPDMGAHQYDQQVNQIHCGIFEDRIYTTNRADANVFGLEPNFGCCTANFHQGWPKLAAHLWAEDAAGDALVCLSPAPCTLTHAHGTITVSGDYPFSDTVTIRQAGTPRRLRLRIPAWAEDPTLDGRPIAGPWVETDAPSATLRLPWTPRVVAAPDGHNVCVVGGPFLFALPIGERWTKLNGDEPAADWEIAPTTAWGYGLLRDPPSPTHCSERARAPRFSPDGAPLRISVRAAPIDWPIERHAAAPPPGAPIVTGAPQTVTLLPYGCTNLRIAVFPPIEEV
jgi:hypothetical protein